MSTAAHEPRRVGPRRAASPSGSEVTPHRNAPEASEPIGIHYDSDEVPVLIRLPNLRDLGSVETQPTPRAQKKRDRISRPRSGRQRTSKQAASKVSKKSFQQQAGSNKLVLGGIVGGILLVVTLFLLNTGGPQPPTEQNGWTNEGAQPELLAQDLDISIPSESETQPQYPVFAYGSPEGETAQSPGGEWEQAPITGPSSDDALATALPEGLASPNGRQPTESWPSEETMGPPHVHQTPPADLWPGKSLSLKRNGSFYPSNSSPDQVDYRSSIYPSESGTYRVGGLDSARPQSTRYDRGDSILNGNIEPPDTTSLR